MPTNLQIRAATPGDTAEILDLVRLSLGEGKIPRHVDYWTWKHQRNPFGASPILLAESEGRLVGLRVFMRWTWRAGGHEWPAVRAVDTATHPDWRGKGIFSRLTLALLKQMHDEGVAFVFNTPNTQSRPGYLKMGWVSVGRTSLWVRPLRPIALVRAVVRRRRADDPVTEDGAPTETGASVRELVQYPGLEAFLAGLGRRDDRFATPRSSAYLRWRYAEIPQIAYRALWSLDGSDGAVLIFREKRDGHRRELRLAEVLIGDTPRSAAMGHDLLGRLLRESDADYATAMVGGGSRGPRRLLRRGFLPAPRLGPVMTVRPLNFSTNGLDPLRRADWHLSIGDLELF